MRNRTGALVQAAQWGLGTVPAAGGARFLVWAPKARSVEVHLLAPRDSYVPLEPVGDGYFGGVVEGAGPGTQYQYRLNDEAEFPDPASHYQPAGVHGPSEIVDPAFDWHDAGWRGVPLADCIFYELHAGTFTGEGTFDAIIPHLEYLAGMGVNAIELMPVAQFPGSRNWGYDGVYPFAAQNSYGGPAGLKRLVDAAHARGLAVVLDVVYNHLGPEGNYLAQFGPYFTERYCTPWGGAVNYDGPDGAPVRRFVVENALRWVTEFHIDALRLDAVHAIFDHSPKHILQELGETVHGRARELEREIYVIAESDSNDVRLIERIEDGGYGLDAQWSDDFHHALHAVVTGERSGYYQDFGVLGDLAKSMREGYVFTGQHSTYRGRPHGTASAHLPPERFVVCAQNHDQIGNRMRGDRLTGLLDFERLKLTAGALLLAPYLPLLFMGQEYAEPAPFQYFVSHGDPGLIEAVRRGRSEEFRAFAWQGDVPDPQSPETFERSRLNHRLRGSGQHRAMLELYRELLRLRKEMPALRRASRDSVEVWTDSADSTLALTRRNGDAEVLAIFRFANYAGQLTVPADAGAWSKVLDSADTQWMGPGSSVPQRAASDGQLHIEMQPASFCLFSRSSA